MGFAVALVFVVQSVDSTRIIGTSESSVHKNTTLDGHDSSQVTVKVIQRRIDDFGAYLRSFELRLANIEQQQNKGLKCLEFQPISK